MYVGSDGRSVLASKCLRTVQILFRVCKAQLFSCDAYMNIFEWGFIHRGFLITLGNYGESNGVIELSNVTSEILQRVCADHSFGTPKAKRFSVTWVEGGAKKFRFTRVLLINYFNARTNMKNSRILAFAKNFKIMRSIDNTDLISNFLC